MRAPAPRNPAPARPMPAALRPVFVISTGRSGSTLVQRLLNCHPAQVVWGEHHGFLASLLGAYMQMSNPGHRQATMFATQPAGVEAAGADARAIRARRWSG